MKPLDAAWIGWIDENVARGVTEQSLIDILVENQFDKAQVTELVWAKTAHRYPENVPVALIKQPPQPPQPKIITSGYEYEPIGPQVANTVQTSDRTVSVLMTLEKPKVIVFGNFLSAEECEQLIEISIPKMDRSTTVDEKTGEAVNHKHRTSSGTYFHINENPFIQTLDRRISEVMQSPIINGEGIQILNYQIGGEYKPHYDYFPPDQAGSAVHVAKGGQRIATLIMYLNTVEEGGETSFPEMNLKVAPVQGSAVYFAYTNSKEQVDPLTLHAGNPVLKGEKWIATKWMRQREYR